jgi:hypothetical protein
MLPAPMHPAPLLALVLLGAEPPAPSRKFPGSSRRQVHGAVGRPEPGPIGPTGTLGADVYRKRRKALMDRLKTGATLVVNEAKFDGLREGNGLLLPDRHRRAGRGAAPRIRRRPTRRSSTSARWTSSGVSGRASAPSCRRPSSEHQRHRARSVAIDRLPQALLRAARARRSQLRGAAGGRAGDRSRRR